MLYFEVSTGARFQEALRSWFFFFFLPASPLNNLFGCNSFIAFWGKPGCLGGMWVQAGGLLGEGMPVCLLSYKQCVPEPVEEQGTSRA